MIAHWLPVYESANRDPPETWPGGEDKRFPGIFGLALFAAILRPLTGKVAPGYRKRT